MKSEGEQPLPLLIRGTLFAMPWVQLKSIQHIKVDGITKTFNPGDWVEVGRQQAARWLASGAAWIPPTQKLDMMPGDCGIVVRGDTPIRQQIDGISIENMTGWPDALPHAYCLFYKSGTMLRTELLQVGFNLLTKWDAVVPLWSYQQVAGQLGDPLDRAATKEAIGDLRVPAYDTRLIYVRANEAGQALMATFAQELGRADLEHHDERLAFLRAVFAVKPRLCAAPVSWVGKQYDA